MWRPGRTHGAGPSVWPGPIGCHTPSAQAANIVRMILPIARTGPSSIEPPGMSGLAVPLEHLPLPKGPLSRLTPSDRESIALLSNFGSIIIQ